MVQFHLGRKLLENCFKLLLCYSELDYVILMYVLLMLYICFYFVFKCFYHTYFVAIFIRGLVF